MQSGNSITLAAACAAAVLGIAATSGASAQDAGEALDEIVVSAQKRAEALSDVPLSVTVLSGDFLEQQQAVNFADLVALIPGFSITATTPGESRITLRGINTGGVATTVGIYMDDVPFGSSSGLANAAILSGDFDTFDVARVEVLRGPQGTLYGASALGGVMKYVTNDPDTEAFEARARASVEDVAGGGTGYAMTGLVNVPLSDRAALRASGFYRNDEGFIDSIGNNPISSLSDPNITIIDGTRVEDDFNSLDTTGGRIALLLTPSDSLSVKFQAMLQNIDSESSNIVDADATTLQPLSGDPVQSRYHRDYTDIEYRVYSATVDWDLGFAALQSVTSYSEFESDFQTDLAANSQLAGAPLAQVATEFFGDATTRPLSVIQQQVTFTDKVTQELRLVSDEDDTFEWLLGLYYTEEDAGIAPQDILAVEAGTDTVATDIPALASGRVPSEFEEIAIFANATWHLTDRFDLSFGARQSENDQKASQVLEGALIGPTIEFDEVTSSESPFTYSISPRFEINDDVAVYARVATGYRPGGPNILPPGTPPGTPGAYDSDELTNYEIGLKADSPGGLFGIDVSAYLLDWDDIQLLAVVNSVGINANGGTAESKGFEFAGVLRPIDGLRISVNGAYTDAQLTQDTDPVVGGLDGDPLPYVPEWGFGLQGTYEWPVFGDALANLGATLAYVGDRPTGFDDRDTNGDIRELDAYTTINLRAGVVFDRWSVELYGHNVTDEEGFTALQGEGILPNGAVGLSVIRPRTIGVAVGVNF